MSVSVMFGTRIPTMPSSVMRVQKAAPMNLTIECSSRPQKKATAHHMKTRPRKSQPWDIRRGPAVYDPLPPLPPDWTLVGTVEADVEVQVAEATPPMNDD